MNFFWFFYYKEGGGGGGEFEAYLTQEESSMAIVWRMKVNTMPVLNDGMIH